jgi:2-C-methyl-D-erythritol 2,4-cyclodiphosphate synthase
MKIGQGFDAHRLETGHLLVIGGVTIPYDKGLVAHSDGDVLIHALCDALLGAAGLGDIGQHFPPNSTAYRNVDSRILLRRVVTMLNERALEISNIDITVIAEEPKLAPYIPVMREILAEDLGVETDRINVKATTTEGMGFAGRGEGIAAYAVVLLDEY